MRIYISGKITGLPIEEAKAKFAATEKYITWLGHEAVNPMAHVPEVPDKTWADYMAEAVKLLLSCQGIWLIHDWKDSKGARIEKAIVGILGLNIFQPSPAFSKQIIAEYGKVTSG